MLAGVLASLTGAAQAELLSTDVSVFNDGLATLDTQTGLEWLDLTETHGINYSNLDNIVANSYPGWRKATIAEIDTLFTNTFDGLVLGTLQTLNSTQTSDFISLFGANSNGFADSFVENDSGVLKLWEVKLTGQVYNGYGSYNQYMNGLAHVGTFLVSDGGLTLTSQNNPAINLPGFSGDVNEVADVSTPIALGALGLFGMLGFSAARRRQK
jgi:hypothetical protein